ncbi:hypothetical protein [Paraglaciecola sp. 2405UD69-4]|uniref:hypothetical protein n=1 Tax=Paraglaciecola sp. 2405UD69-4 TaxID=3391836 RepID=UPI0039C9957D
MFLSFMCFALNCKAQSNLALLQKGEAKTILLPGKQSGPSNPLAIFVRKIIDTSYVNLGFKVEHLGYPMARSIVEANAGRLDGVLIRTDTVTNDYPNLIKVPYALAEFEIMLVTDPARCHPCNVENLDIVATVRGFKAFDYYLAKNQFTPHVTEVLNMSHLLEMLSSGRVNGIVIPYHKDVGIELNEKWATKVLDVYSSYHFVHKKHAALVPLLVEEFKALDKAFSQSQG